MGVVVTGRERVGLLAFTAGSVALGLYVANQFLSRWAGQVVHRRKR